MHENLHKNVNENMFSFTFMCKFSWVFMKHNLSSFILLISKYGLDGGPVLLDCIKFS